MMTDPLFEPLKLKYTALKNRLVMGSLHTGLEDIPGGNKRMVTFYKKRAEGGVGLIITGGVSPNFRGRLHFLGKQLSFWWQVFAHKKITKVVHDAGAKICLQILHAGRYAHHPFCVGPSALKAPINKYTPKEMSEKTIRKTISDFINTAKLAHNAGYDGIEIMGSEGYLINEFLALKTNQRTDEWGGSFENRMKFSIEIAKGIRENLPKEFIIIYRISLLDLVENGNTWDETSQLAKKLEAVGVDLFDSGIGWHEARIPTIATMVPRNAFIELTDKLKKTVNIPVMATNRINMPEPARKILNDNKADLISMARPWLADENWGIKAQQNNEAEINTCIACNQACLDHIFKGKVASCLVNPKACFENDYIETTTKKFKIAIIGAGPSGLASGIEAGRLGHDVVIFEKNDEIGGQFNYAKDIPGKEEFRETIRYFKAMVKKYNIDLRLNTKVDSAFLKKEKFDHLIFSTGVKPFTPKIKGIENPMVLSYPEAIKNPEQVGKNVAVIGAGGIGFDVSALLLREENQTIENFCDEWGIDLAVKDPGGLKKQADNHHAKRNIYLLQRKAKRFGLTLGKTTGWAHRKELQKKGVQMIAGVEYQEITPGKLHLKVRTESRILEVDNIIVCAGQRSENTLYQEFKDLDFAHLIGGALKAGEIDAKRAMEEGVKLISEISK